MLSSGKVEYDMKILIIEDEYTLLKAMEEFLLVEKYVVEKAAGYHAAIEKIMMYEDV
jgi:DNA-binding response OmpR family regulator